MPGPVLILGGTGNFGRRIAEGLTARGVPVVVAGRNREKTERAAAALPRGLAQTAAFDVRDGFATHLAALGPAVVVNTCGPFQTSDYAVARDCIAQGVHYIDLADGRDFVADIVTLDQAAKVAGVTVISGASTVPGLSSAVVAHFRNEFLDIDSLIYGINPGQKTERGLATTQAILTYVGKALKPFAGAPRTVFGWQDIHRQNYPELGRRWMANCDVPDLDLLPRRYGIKSIRFSAGLELGALHLGLWLLSWIVRAGIPLDLPRHASLLIKASNLFDAFGTADGGMHVILRGTDVNGLPHRRRWFVIAKNGCGPQIPCVPAIVLAQGLATGGSLPVGAYPCVGVVTLEDYMDALSGFQIRQIIA